MLEANGTARRVMRSQVLGPVISIPTKREARQMMNSLLLYALQQHKRHVRKSAMDLVFPNADGKPYEASNLLQRVLHPALASCGLRKTGWRVFRRSVATTLSEMREPVRTTQQVLGHSSPHTTLAFYTQSVEESQRNAISKLEGIMFPNVPKFEKGSPLIH